MSCFNGVGCTDYYRNNGNIGVEETRKNALGYAGLGVAGAGAVVMWLGHNSKSTGIAVIPNGVGVRKAF